MSFLSPSPPAAAGPDPALEAARIKAEADATKKREEEESRKREEAAQTSAGLRGSRSFLTADFTGFTNGGRSFFTPTGS